MKRLLLSSLLLLWTLFQSLQAQQMENFEVLWQVQSFHGDTEAFGIALAGGDLNGDGYVDLIVGGHTLPPYHGFVYVFWGPDFANAPDITLTSPWKPTSLPYTHFGLAVTSGDFNGDGVQDLAVGDENFYDGSRPTNSSGRVYVYFGGAAFDTLPDLILDTPPPQSWWFGRSVANVGDVNGDGYEDLGVGAPGWPYAYPPIGKVYIYFGGPGLDDIPDVELVGFPDEQNFGLEIGGGEDVNGDGYDDVLVASMGPEDGNIVPLGRIFVFFGGDPMDSLWDFTVASRWGREFGTTGGVVALKNFTHWGYADVAAAAHGVVDTGVVFRGEERIKPNPVAKLLEEQQTAIEEFGYDLAASGVLNFSALSVSNRDYDNYHGKVYFYVGGYSFDTTADAFFEGQDSVALLMGEVISPAGDITSNNIDELLLTNLVSYDPQRLPQQVWLITYTGTGIQEPPVFPPTRQRISIFPTVAKDYVNIVFSGMRQSPVEIIVYDATGRRIYTKEVMSHEGQLSWRLVDQWGHRVPDGIYFLQVLTNRRKVAMERVMVIKKSGGEP